MSVSTIGSSRPDGALTAGIDWASSEHAVAVVDEHGVQLQRAVVPHTTAGLTQLVRLLHRAGVREIGIERGDGPMVEAVQADDFVVFVIPRWDTKPDKCIRRTFATPDPTAQNAFLCRRWCVTSPGHRHTPSMPLVLG